MKFSPNYVIWHGEPRLVQLVGDQDALTGHIGGPAYDRDEWNHGLSADYECDGETGDWTFLGEPFTGQVFGLKRTCERCNKTRKHSFEVAKTTAGEYLIAECPNCRHMHLLAQK